VNLTAFYGTIYTGDLEVLRTILQQWLGPESLDTKIRLSGEELTYESENLYVYCHNAVGQTDNPRYLLEGNTSVGLDETSRRLKELLKLCQGHNVVCSLEYVEVNEAGEEVSELFELAI